MTILLVQLIVLQRRKRKKNLDDADSTCQFTSCVQHTERSRGVYFKNDPRCQAGSYVECSGFVQGRRKGMKS